jgi:hypothetical protein
VLWKRTPTGMTPVRVKLGLSDGTVTALVDGELQPGDELVTGVTGVAATSNMPKLGVF